MVFGGFLVGIALEKIPKTDHSPTLEGLLDPLSKTH